jgi:CRP-like cAMP-binding protein
MDRTIWYFKRCDLFERLTDDQASRLNRAALLKRFPRGATVYSPTEPGRSVLVLGKGRVKIKSLTPDGRESILAFIDEGELFGELALLDGQPRGEYAEAVVDSEVLLLPREEVVWLMGVCADFALSITKLIGLRRLTVENRLRNVLFLSSRERLVRLLLELAESHGDLSGRRCEIRLPLSHQELASLIGVTRETVTVVLGELQRGDLVRVQRRRLVLLDVDRLQACEQRLATKTTNHPASPGRRLRPAPRGEGNVEECPG